MQDHNWRSLKKIVEADDFRKPSGFDTSLVVLLKKAVEAKSKEMSSAADQKTMNLAWLRELCSGLGIQAKGATRAVYLKDALLKIYQADKEAMFWKEVSNKRRVDSTSQEGRKKALEDLYYSLCDSTDSGRLEKLKSYFVQDDKLEEKLKEFRKEFGVRAGVRRATKLETRLKAIAQELGSRKGVEGFD